MLAAAASSTTRPAAPDDIGLLRDPVKPLALNCLAARVLSRLAALTGREELQARALDALASQTGVYRSLGHRRRALRACDHGRA